MDSILELDRAEAREIKDIVTANKDLFVSSAAALFDDCFNLLLS